MSCQPINVSGEKIGAPTVSRRHSPVLDRRRFYAVSARGTRLANLVFGASPSRPRLRGDSLSSGQRTSGFPPWTRP